MTGPPANAALLLLADSRLPAGGHAHSGGLEPAATAGAVRDLATLADFLRGRLATAGLVAAGLAAASVSGDRAALDAEADARTPSPAQRRASRAQGRALLRAARAAWPHPDLDGLTAPHHPVVLGAVVHVVGGDAGQAAAIAAYASVTGPASAAVRLLGLDPLGVQRVLADLAVRIDAVAASAAETVRAGGLPAASAPALDLLAEIHQQADLRLFES
ncbi:urease accessory UreF family protein [Actinoallomurus bryophytorum]|uniref:Urease accessory protein UreF n=1 Tax=Actinoallomurus bryophytorum TaxID=1490222 RepID=A0A543CCS7_9ACTN|nr:urease accessory UreF family protein [Actinoallomurus bryophytorum]TQL94884.1 urease accessory protein [Actinoallomurus bryophytorum]